MHVPYGFGVGDFVAVGTLAWSVYISCKFQPHPGYQPSKTFAGKTAPASFENIRGEVFSLYTILKTCDDTLFNRPLQPTNAEGLVDVKDGCVKVLMDLQRLVDKYKSLGTQSKRTRDRMKWSSKDVAEIRDRLISHTTMLNVIITASHAAKFDKFIEQRHQGKREASFASIQTVDSLSTEDKARWRAIRKDLEKKGITIDAFDANKDHIFKCFTHAKKTEAFEEEGKHDLNEENNHCDQQASHDHHESVNQYVRRAIRHIQSDPFNSIRERQLLVAATVAEYSPPECGPGVFPEVVSSPKTPGGRDLHAANLRPKLYRRKAFYPQ